MTSMQNPITFIPESNALHNLPLARQSQVLDWQILPVESEVGLHFTLLYSGAWFAKKLEIFSEKEIATQMSKVKREIHTHRQKKREERLS